MTLIRYEKDLKKLKVIGEIEIFLSKQNQLLQVSNASSGELTLITSLLYLAANITDGAIVLIDEPENSLHPKWQTEYVKLLMDNFYMYHLKIIIATHSPLIINAAEITSNGVRVYKGISGNFEMQMSDTQNVEEIYKNLFDVITPENRYLSEDIISQMNALAEGKLSLMEFEAAVLDYKGSSYDDKQKEVLNEILSVGRQIIERRIL